MNWGRIDCFGVFHLFISPRRERGGASINPTLVAKKELFDVLTITLIKSYVHSQEKDYYTYLLRRCIVLLLTQVCILFLGTFGGKIGVLIGIIYIVSEF